MFVCLDFLYIYNKDQFVLRKIFRPVQNINSAKLREKCCRLNDLFSLPVKINGTISNRA